MLDESDSRPTTFREDRFRFAHTKTSGRLMPLLKDHLAQFVTMSVALFIGIALYGSTFLEQEARPFVSMALALLVVVVIYAVILSCIWFYYWWRAPQALWQRDRATIEQLRDSLRPSLLLSFDESDCIRTLRCGSRSHSIGGNRFHDIKRGERHYMVKCSSEVGVDDVAVYLVGIERELSHRNKPTNFFAPVQLRVYSDEVSEIQRASAPPALYLSMIKQVSEYDRPYINSERIFDYDFLFERPGIYVLKLLACGKNTTSAELALEMCLKTGKTQVDSLGHRGNTYEIVWMRAART